MLMFNTFNNINKYIIISLFLLLSGYRFVLEGQEKTRKKSFKMASLKYIVSFIQ